MELTVKCGLSPDGYFEFESFKNRYEEVVGLIADGYRREGFVTGYKAAPYLSLMEMQLKALDSTADAVLSLIHQDNPRNNSTCDEMWANLEEFPVAKQMVRTYYVNWYSGRMAMKNPYKYADVMEVFLGRMLLYPKVLLPQTEAVLRKIVPDFIWESMLTKLEIKEVSSLHAAELEKNKKKLKWPATAMHDFAISCLANPKKFPTVACSCCFRLFHAPPERLREQFNKHPCTKNPALSNWINVNTKEFAKVLNERINCLNEDQKSFYKAITETNMNVIAIAPAGCGKSYTSRVAMFHLANSHGRESFLNLYFTNKMAKENNGETIHNVFKLHMMTPRTYDYIHRFENETKRDNKVEEFIAVNFPNIGDKMKFIIARTMFIDEVGNLTRDLIEFLDIFLRKVRGNKNVPFGGMQVVLYGDPAQNAPYDKGDTNFNNYCIKNKRYFNKDGYGYFFTSPQLPNYRFMWISFDMLKNNRFSDENLKRFLAHARLSEIDDIDLNWLRDNQSKVTVPPAIQNLLYVMDMWTHCLNDRDWSAAGFNLDSRNGALEGKLDWERLPPRRYTGKDVIQSRQEMSYKRGQFVLKDSVAFRTTLNKLKGDVNAQILCTENSQLDGLEKFLGTHEEFTHNAKWTLGEVFISKWNRGLKSGQIGNRVPVKEWNGQNQKSLDDNDIDQQFKETVLKEITKEMSKKCKPSLRFSVGDVLQLTQGRKEDFMNNYDMVIVKKIECASDGETPIKIEVEMCDLGGFKNYKSLEIEPIEFEVKFNSEANGRIKNKPQCCQEKLNDLCFKVRQFPLLRPSALTCPVAAGLTILSGVAWSNSRRILSGNGYAACSRVTKPEDLCLSHIPESVSIANNHDFRCHEHARVLIKYLDDRSKRPHVFRERKGLITGDFYIDYDTGEICVRNWGSRFKPKGRRRVGVTPWLKS